MKKRQPEYHITAKQNETSPIIKSNEILKKERVHFDLIFLESRI